MIHGQTWSAGLAEEPFLITLMRAFMIRVSLLLFPKIKSVVNERGYFPAFSGGTSIIQGHTWSARFTLPPLATTLMLRFMAVVLFLSDYGFELTELIDGNVNEPRTEDAGLRFAGAFFVLGHVLVLLSLLR